MVRDQCTVEIHLEQSNFFELQRNEICISFTYSLYPTPTHLCIFSVKKSVIINCCFMATSAICDGHLSIKSVQWSLIYPDINDLDVSPSEDI